MFTMIDAATKWLEAVPRTSIDSEHTVKAFLSKCGTKQTFTTPYWPQGNGVIERHHRTLKDRLCTSFLQYDGQWIDHQQQAVFDINRTTNTGNANGISAFRFTYGTDANAAKDWPIFSDNDFTSSLPTPKYIYPNVHDPKSLDPRRSERIAVQTRLSDQLVRVVSGQVFNLNKCFGIY